MTTDYRALCAELFAAIQLYTGQNPAAADIPSNELVRGLMDAMAATAAALAQPEPQGPTDEELVRVYQAAYQPAWERGEFHGCHVDGLRAVLARWGHPTPQPIAVSERLPGLEDCDADGRCWWWCHSMEAWELDDAQRHYAHWLPAYALPLPTT